MKAWFAMPDLDLEWLVERGSSVARRECELRKKMARWIRGCRVFPFDSYWRGRLRKRWAQARTFWRGYRDSEITCRLASQCRISMRHIAARRLRERKGES